MTEAILILAGGTSQIPLVRAVKSLGILVVVVDRNEAAPCRDMSDYFICESTEEPGAILAKIQALPQQFRFRAVWTQSSGPAAVTQTILARELGIPHFPPRLASLSVDKEAFGEFLRKKKFAVPRSFRACIDVGHLSFPIVVRPAVTTFGKRMIFRVDDPNGLALAVEQSLKVSRNFAALISEYVPGEDVILIGIRGKDTVEKIALVREYNRFDAGKVVNLGYELVRNERRYPIAAMEAELDRLFDLTGGGWGVFLASFRCSREQFYWIELHLDFGGDYLFEKLLTKALGQDSLAWTLSRLLGPARQAPIPFRRPSLIYTLAGRDAENLLRVSSSLDRATCEILLDVQPTPSGSTDRIGVVSITGDHEVDCRRIARRLDDLLGRSAETFPPLSEEFLAA
jgi:hypothetical protein